MNKKLRKKLIGHVGVDTGQLLVVDPCYIDSMWIQRKFEGSEFSNEFSYNGVCQTTLSDKKCGELVIGSTSAVAFSSGYGDGVYPVYAYFNKDSRIVKIEIIME